MIVIDYMDRTPIYEQIVNRVKELVLLGALQPDTQMPSVRSLAMELSINPNTIQRAYTELERQNVIYCVKGRGNFVSSVTPLKEQRLRELWGELEAIVKKAIQAGVLKEDMIKQVELCYTGGAKV